MTATPYFTRVGEHLAASRRENPRMSFAGAWTQALKTHPCPGNIQGFTADVMDFARRHFSTGYYRHSLGSAGLLAEDRDGYVSTVPPVAEARRCGSGEGCRRFARPGGFLCEDHHEEIQAAIARSAYRGRGEHIREASARANTARTAA